MFLFQQIEDAKAIVKIKGLYKQVDVYHRQGYLYVRYTGGYAALIRDVVTQIGTTVPNLRVDALYMPDNMEDKVWTTNSSRLCLGQCAHKYKEFKIENP